MSTDSPEEPRQLPDRPNLRHLKDQAKDLLKAGGAESLTDPQFQIAPLWVCELVEGDTLSVACLQSQSH